MHTFRNFLSPVSYRPLPLDGVLLSKPQLHRALDERGSSGQVFTWCILARYSVSIGDRQVGSRSCFSKRERICFRNPWCLLLGTARTCIKHFYLPQTVWVSLDRPDHEAHRAECLILERGPAAGPIFALGPTQN